MAYVCGGGGDWMVSARDGCFLYMYSAKCTSTYK